MQPDSGPLNANNSGAMHMGFIFALGGLLILLLALLGAFFCIRWLFFVTGLRCILIERRFT